MSITVFEYKKTTPYARWLQFWDSVSHTFLQGFHLLDNLFQPMRAKVIIASGMANGDHIKYAPRVMIPEATISTVSLSRLLLGQYLNIASDTTTAKHPKINSIIMFSFQWTNRTAAPLH